MSYQALSLLNHVFALLSLGVLVGAAALTMYRVVGGKQASAKLGEKLGADWALWAAWAIAAVATLGSLFYSEVAHFVPCRLCWFQRIAMYPLAVVLLVGAVRRDRGVRFYVLPIAAVGVLISVWHNLIQFFPGLEGGGSCDPTVPCSARSIAVFGFMDLPFMALAGFLGISVLVGLYAFRATGDAVSATPEAE